MTMYHQGDPHYNLDYYDNHNFSSLGYQYPRTMDGFFNSTNGTIHYLNYDYYYNDIYNGTYPTDFPCIKTINMTCNMNWEGILEHMPGYDLCINKILPTICSVGIVGIILTIIVLSRKTMSTSTNSYLISLAMSDLGFLLIMAAKSLETKLSYEAHYQYLFVMSYVNIFLNVFLLSSVWLTVMLAVERYIAICHPLRAMGICTVVRARIFILVIVIVSFLLRIPEFFKYEPFSFCDQCLGKEVTRLVPTELNKSDLFRSIYAWSDCVIIAVLPFSLLLFLNVCLIREIHRSTNYLRYHLASDSNVQTIITGEEIKITMMLISVVVVFFSCEAPFVLTTVLKRLHTIEMAYNFQLWRNISILLLVLRSSFNFILYCWFSEKFWNTFKKTFCMPQCFLTHAPNWLRSRVWNHSDHGHSNNNHTAAGHGEMRTTTTHYAENGLVLKSCNENNHQPNDIMNSNV